VHDNAAATAGNIAAHEWLFGSGMLSDLFRRRGPDLPRTRVYRLFKGLTRSSRCCS